MPKLTLEQKVRGDLKTAGYDFKLNDLSETIYVKKDNGEWEQMSKVIASKIDICMRNIKYGDKGKPWLSDLEKIVLIVADENRYNPIDQYFKSLAGKYAPGTDGPYLIPQLARYTTNPDDMFGGWLFKWMVGSIAKFYEQERNPMLVIVGPQEIGKSWLVRWLCPIDEQYFTQTQLINADKDKLLEMAELFLMEIEELDATTAKATVGILKSLITKSFIRVRPPYGRRPIRKHVPASFIGTVNYNEAGFLNDPSGLTRFLTTEVTEIDFDYTKMSIDSLWAEAYHYYQHGAKAWKLTPTERAKQAELNERFEQASPLIDFILHNFSITHNTDDFISSYKIRGIAQNKGYRINNERAFQMELGSAMTKLKLRSGRKRLNNKSIRGYTGIRLEV